MKTHDVYGATEPMCGNCKTTIQLMTSAVRTKLYNNCRQVKFFCINIYIALKAYVIQLWRCFKHVLNICYCIIVLYIRRHSSMCTIFTRVTLKPSSLQMNCWLQITTIQWQVKRNENTATESSKQCKVDTKVKTIYQTCIL